MSLTSTSNQVSNEPHATLKPSWQSPATGLSAGLALVATAGLRAWNVGQLSFWYDEVVTMRLAQSPGPAALFERLFQIDATRAPLHPLVLQGWLRLFGASEASARMLSVLCGVLTVTLVVWIGQTVFEARTGVWAAWLSALSPLLIYYSREARMYSWLVMVTCLCWGLLLSHKTRCLWGAIGYAMGLTALLYSNPLGLLMVATLGLGSLLFVRQYFGTVVHWLVAHLVGVLLAAPWIGYYFDHEPEFVSGRLPIRFLLGTPIGFIGGNSAVLLILLGVVAFGLVRRRSSFGRLDSVAGPVCLGLWLVVPPTLLYAYSWIGSPIFGPSRYTLFVAPPYLILVAQGLALLPRLTRYTLAIGIYGLAVHSLVLMAYAPDLKADWRACALAIGGRIAANPEARVTVIVKSSDPARNVEVETARYYLPAQCRVLSWKEPLQDLIKDSRYGDLVFVAVPSKGRDDSPEQLDVKSRRLLIAETHTEYPGLIVYLLDLSDPYQRDH